MKASPEEDKTFTVNPIVPTPFHLNEAMDGWLNLAHFTSRHTNVVVCVSTLESVRKV